MGILMIIKILIAMIAMAYVASLLRVVFYEFKMEKIYREKKSALEGLKGTRLSGAVIGAKAFKIEQDYKKMVGILDKRQRLLLRKMPYFRRAYL